MTAAFDGAYTVHAYGSSRAFVDNYVVNENICFERGPFLIGGGKPSSNIRAAGNILYKVSMRIGYNAPYNEDCEIRNNTVIDGGLEITGFKSVVKDGNRLLGTAEKRPSKNEATWFLNSYDPARAHLAVFNVERLPVVAVPGSPFLKAGERFRILEATDFYGPAVAESTYEGGDLRFPLGREFGAFVVVK